MGLLGDIAGAVIGAGSSIWSSNNANNSAFQMQANSLAAQKEALQNKHQWEVEDLRKAGLNPILSANSAGGGISGATANITAPDISGAISKIANSALARKQTELAEKELEVKQTNANANLVMAGAKELEAQNDTARTHSAVALNASQTDYNYKMLEYTDTLIGSTKQRMELDKALNNAQVSEINQRIINATLQTYAEIEFKKKSGDAALMSASASQRSAAAQEIIARVAEENGISQRTLNNALTEKGRAETAESLSRAAQVDWNTRKDKARNQYADSAYTDPFAGTLMRVGETIKTLNPLQGFFK